MPSNSPNAPSAPHGPLAEWRARNPGLPPPETVVAQDELARLETRLERARAHYEWARRTQPGYVEGIRRAKREVERLELEESRLHGLAYPAAIGYSASADEEAAAAALVPCKNCGAGIARSRVFDFAGRCGVCWNLATHAPDHEGATA